MATIRFTEDDRDERGFVKVAPARNPEPRSLADLLPTPAQNAPTPTKRPMTQLEMISLATVAIVAAGVLVSTWRGSGDVPSASPPRPARTAQTSGDAAVVPSPLPATVPAAAGRLLIAFAAPDGQPLAPVPTARPAAVVQPRAADPPPTPEPQPPCLTAGTGAQVVTVCDWGDLASLAQAKWIATYGGNIGIVTTPTPWNGGKP